MDIEAAEHKALKRKQFAVGALFALALSLSVLFAYWMGALGLGASNKLHIVYDFAGGIQMGSPVRLAGIKVGRVSDIRFDKNNVGKIQVTLKIEKSAFEQITQDSKFYVNMAGLIGERYVEVVTGEGSRVKENETLEGINPPRIDQLFSQGYGIFGDVREFYQENKSDIKEMFNSLSDLSKSLNRLMGTSTPEQRKELRMMISNLSSMSTDLRTTMATVSQALRYIQEHGGSNTWDGIAESIAKVRSVERNDIRKLMLEDGVKVNFSSRKVVDEKKEKQNKDNP